MKIKSDEKDKEREGELSEIKKKIAKGNNFSRLVGMS
jgi:hypothetical protein